MIDTWSLVLPYRTPPLTLNRHLHHMAEHRIKGEVQKAAHLIARAHRIPHLRAITAELVWMKGDNRKADPDNMAPTMKPCLDGVKAAGVIDDDDSDHVLRSSTSIILARNAPYPGARLVLKIRDMSALAVHL